MDKREKIAKGVRFEVFKRDGFRCQYCGRTPPAVILEVDHIVAIAQGGDSKQENLITSCEECNRGKGARLLEQVPQSLKDQIEERKERAAQVEAYNAFLLQERERQQEIIDELGRYWFNKYKRKKDWWTFGPGRVPSIRNFLKHLAPVVIMEAMDIAHARFVVFESDDGEDREEWKAWRYFCGVCWRRIKGD